MSDVRKMSLKSRFWPSNFRVFASVRRGCIEKGAIRYPWVRPRPNEMRIITWLQLDGIPGLAAFFLIDLERRCGALNRSGQQRSVFSFNFQGAEKMLRLV